MSKKNKLIICSGDSFTFGDELGVDYLVPGYTSNLYPVLQKATTDRLKLQKKLIDQLNIIWKTPNLLYPIYQQACNSRAWPAYLEKLTNYKIINCARGGISNDEIVHRAMVEFNIHRKLHNPKNITVILMTTTMHRVGYPVYGKKVGKYKFQSFIASTPRDNIEPPYMQPLFDFYFTHLTDYDHFWRSASQLVAAKQYFESFGSKVLFVDSGLWDEPIDQIRKINKEEVDHICSLVNISAKMSDTTTEDNHILPGYHYDEYIHLKFAEKITSIL